MKSFLKKIFVVKLARDELFIVKDCKPDAESSSAFRVVRFLSLYHYTLYADTTLISSINKQTKKTPITIHTHTRTHTLYMMRRR